MSLNRLSQKWGPVQSDLQDILNAEQEDFDEVSRRCQELKKLGSQADEVANEAKDLIDQMTDSQSTMAKTKAQIDDITASSRSFQELIAIREAAVREYMPQLEAEAIAGSNYYRSRIRTFRARCTPKAA